MQEVLFANNLSYLPGC